MTSHSPALPPLKADLLLIHAPAFFDFRNRRDIYFPFLGTSGDVPITPLYEYFPVGFKTLQRYLSSRGHEVKIANLSTVLLRYRNVDIDRLIESIDARLVGIDLHWMVHVQGSLAVAERIKAARKDLPVVFGGISSTYYAGELIRYPYVDMVMRGYDTHEPMARLLDDIKAGAQPADVPNLLWKSRDGEVHENGFTYTPDTYGCGIDWSQQPEPVATQSLPIKEVLSTQNVGCAYNCPWCGGSREAFRRINGRQKAMARKPLDEVAREFDSMQRVEGIEQYYFYSVGSYNESRSGMEFFLDQVARTPLKSISYEQFHLTPDAVLKRMADANKRTIITLSPESHDQRISKLAGRGVYSNDEMERWLDKALGYGIHQVDIWFFVGMPEQDRTSVMETVDYCHRLLEKFKGRRVNPMVCPMIPFLDPASTFFEYPEKHGFKVFHRTVEQHRRGMESASIINRINYETRWLSRRELVEVGFEAVKRLMSAKAATGMLPGAVAEAYNAKVDDALRFIPEVHEADCIESPVERRRALESLGDDIQKRNDAVLFSGVMNQAMPLNRQIGGRWFDELGWEASTLEIAQEQGTAHAGNGALVSPPVEHPGGRSRFPGQV